MSEDGFALVVGGSGGLGAACAEALAAQGQEVVVTYRRGAKAAEAVCARIHAAGGRASSRSLDLPHGDPGSLAGLHTLVWAVGADIGQPYISAATPQDLRDAVDVELHGFFAMVRHALPALRTQRGSIVALTSAGNRRHPPGDVLSTAPKAAIEAVIRGVAREEGRYGVRANAVAVGVVEAGIFHRIGFEQAWIDAAVANTPLRRLGRAEDVAQAVAYLASSQASYVTGEILHVDGGYHV